MSSLAKELPPGAVRVVARLLDFQGATRVWFLLCIHQQGCLVNPIKLSASRRISLAFGRDAPTRTQAPKMEAPRDLMLAAAVPSALRTFPEGRFLAFTHHSIPAFKALVFRHFMAKEVPLACLPACHPDLPLHRLFLSGDLPLPAWFGLGGGAIF